jgi:hypothetical protein
VIAYPANVYTSLNVENGGHTHIHADRERGNVISIRFTWKNIQYATILFSLKSSGMGHVPNMKMYRPQRNVNILHKFLNEIHRQY